MLEIICQVASIHHQSERFALLAGWCGVPRFIKKAYWSYVVDADDNRYIDYVGSWGPMVLGHAHPSVLRAVHKAVENGLSFWGSL